MPLRIGSRVLIRPYSGLRLSEIAGHKDIAFFGVTRPLEDSLLCVGGKNDSWHPLFDWVHFLRDVPMASSVMSLETPRLDTATVNSAGPRAAVVAGERIVVTRHPNQTLRFQFGDVEGELVKEWDTDSMNRPFRQIYSTIEE